MKEPWPKHVETAANIDYDAMSNIDEFEDDEDNALDEEDCEALEDLKDDVEEAEEAVIEEESCDQLEVTGLTEEDIQLGVSSLTKVCCHCLCLRSICTNYRIASQTRQASVPQEHPSERPSQALQKEDQASQDDLLCCNSLEHDLDGH